MQRLARSKQYGQWNNWFTERDVAALQPALQPYLDRFYPQADWRLSARPMIDPAHGSAYVRRLVNEARAASALGQLPETSDERST
ncbi:MAG TPA: hypothetical protein VHG29_01635 [Novosphingobium sp.]|nr:hypothetical protein [Novosphingobium sp.]